MATRNLTDTYRKLRPITMSKTIPISNLELEIQKLDQDIYTIQNNISKLDKLSRAFLNPFINHNTSEFYNLADNIKHDFSIIQTKIQNLTLPHAKIKFADQVYHLSINFKRILESINKHHIIDIQQSHEFASDPLLVQQLDTSFEQREQDIQKLATSISDLASIFKDMSNLTVYQGTILDRIDYSVDNASNNIDLGNQELKEAKTYQNSSFNKCCILLLIIFILILAVIATLRYLL